MLILSRKQNESIVIDGRITVTVMRVDGEVVKLGIAAPADVPVHRQEVYDEIRKNNHAAITHRSSPVPRLAVNGAARLVRPRENRGQDRPLKSDKEGHKLNRIEINSV